jgi:hypothetical protein
VKQFWWGPISARVCLALALASIIALVVMFWAAT